MRRASHKPTVRSIHDRKREEELLTAQLQQIFLGPHGLGAALFASALEKALAASRKRYRRWRGDTSRYMPHMNWRIS